jgi:hypothetical protein
MNTNATKVLVERTSEVAAPLSIVLIFDHPAMAATTRSMLDGFITKWAHDVDVHRDEWTFAELGHPKFRTEALELAKSCDILVIAISEGDLDVSFVDWLDEWALSRNRMETALILLIPSHATTVSAVPRCASIQTLAHKHGLTFFSTSVTPSPRVPPPFLHPKELLARLSLLNTNLLPDFSGLND